MCAGELVKLSFCIIICISILKDNIDYCMENCGGELSGNRCRRPRNRIGLRRKTDEGRQNLGLEKVMCFWLWSCTEIKIPSPCFKAS